MTKKREKMTGINVRTPGHLFATRCVTTVLYCVMPRSFFKRSLKWPSNLKISPTMKIRVFSL